jgi:hypothetical protein
MLGAEERRQAYGARLKPAPAKAGGGGAPQNMSLGKQG